jgi:hypothetical protein
LPAYLTTMPRNPKPIDPNEPTEQWTLPPGALLGSSIRAKGIYLELRARLPHAAKKCLGLHAGVLTLRKGELGDAEFAAARATVAAGLVGIETLQVLPRELEDILSIRTSERHRWLKDGRLHSLGTRTVKLRGRAKAITFHVYDPRYVEDLLDRDMVDHWREDDAIAKIENRRRAAEKARLTRATRTSPAPAPGEEARTGLVGWEDFAREGLLR